MDWKKWLKGMGIVYDRAYRDTYEHVLEEDMSLRDAFEYAKWWSRIQWKAAKDWRTPSRQAVINTRWGTQYQHIAMHLLHELRRENA
jgi:hypothetical protein